jgi:hypothetical protein
MINTGIVKAMDDEGNQLVGLKGPIPSLLMSNLKCNVCKVWKYIIVIIIHFPQGIKEKEIKK